MDVIGPFFTGDCMMYADIMLAPFALRFDSVLKHYRGFQVSAMIKHKPNTYDCGKKKNISAYILSSLITFSPPECFLYRYPPTWNATTFGLTRSNSHLLL